MIIVPTNVFRASDPEPEVIESTNALEVPLTGFVCHVRLDTVRLVGYIGRGMSPENVVRDNTLTIHMPRIGFRKSMAYAIERWNGAVRKGVH
jgi:hypothetical protein